MEELKPLGIKCTSSDCDNELHCFKATPKMKRDHQEGKCRSCGVDLVNWERLNRQDLSDVLYTFSMLKNELIRHHFWHVEIDQKAENHARRKGSIKLREAAEKLITRSVGSATPYRDGFQTPKAGNIIYYAQHATACCCRTCMEYWHGIEKGRELTQQEISYLTELVMLYINDRLPTLTDKGEHIPTLRQLHKLTEGKNDHTLF